MKWNKIIAFKESQKEVGRISTSTAKDTAHFKITGRIWGWSAENDSELMQTINGAFDAGIKKAKVYLNTGGGSVVATAEIANQLDRFEDVKIEVGALVASAGTYLTSKYHTTIKSNTQGMIHKPSMRMRGNEDEVQADLKLLKNLTEQYAATYAKKTGKTVEEIKKLWSKGDYWMNAKQMKDLGFADAIQGEIEAFDDTDITALATCGAPNIPKKTVTEIKSKMDREELIALYGLEASATDDDIIAAAKAAKVAAEKFKNSQEETKQRIANEKQAEVIAYVDTLIKDKKVTADKYDSLVKLGAADFASLKALHKNVPSVPQLTKEINLTSSAESEANRDKWTLEDWIDKDPDGYKKLIAQGDDTIDRFENDYFNEKHEKFI